MDTYKKLFGYVPECRAHIYGTTILSGLAAIMQTGSYWFLWKFLEELIIKHNVPNSIYYATVILSLLLLYGITYFASLWISHLMAFRLETNLRKAGIDNLMKAPFSFFDSNPSGKIRKLIDDNAADTHMIIAHLTPDTVGAIVTPIVMFIVVFMVDFRLGIIIVIMTIGGFIAMKAMMGNQEFLKQYNKALEILQSQSIEYVRGMQVVKIFRATVDSFKSLYTSIVSYSKIAYDYTLTCRTPYVLFQVLFQLIITFAIPVYIISMHRGMISDEAVAKLVFFATFGGLLFVSFMKVMYVSMYNFLASEVVNKLENLFKGMLDKEIKHGSRDKMESFDIAFENVSFGYGEDMVIENLSLTFEENKTYALVGSSGGGKSTIAKLISGFYKADSGSIKIGGYELSEYTQETIMKNIAFVFQHAKLFKTSIYENVKMGNENASREEVMKALSDARCDDILDKFPDRENTVIGSKGVYLSGGETQRIAIARAILKDAGIVILDEASAAADPENEYEIQQGFSNLMRGKTVIMIAHRFSSIRGVDEILVVDGGRVIERGSDEELMKLGKRYKELQDLFSKANEWKI